MGNGLRVFAWNWHTPYWSLMRKALPADRQLYLSPTSHAPTGWREDQRPFPKGVTITAAPDAADDVVICQTEADLMNIRATPLRRAIYLSHNHVALEGTAPDFVRQWEMPLVCISDIKSHSWRQAGCSEPITVIPPGIPGEDYGGWRGDGRYALTVCNGIRRPLFDLRAWQDAAQRAGCMRLIGGGNDGIPHAEGPAPSRDALREAYRGAATYVNPTCPPYEDTYNLASLEAAATGCPVVNLHGEHPPITSFPFDRFAQSWRRVLSEVANG